MVFTVRLLQQGIQYKKKKTFTGTLRLSDIIIMHILCKMIRCVCVTGCIVINGYFTWLRADSAPQHTSLS